MDADRSFLAADPESSLFSFWVATPKANIFENQLALAKWENGEKIGGRRPERITVVVTIERVL